MARYDASKDRARRDRDHNHDHDRDRRSNEFYESMAAPTARPYYDQEVMPDYSPAEQVVRIAAGVLNLLLALRFVLALFTSNTGNAFVNVLFAATNWLVAPFQALFGTPPTGGTGYFDLPALAAIITVSVLAWVISLIIKGTRPAEDV